MKTYHFETMFFTEDNCGTQNIIVQVPDGTYPETVWEILKKEHGYLKEYPDRNGYAGTGRRLETLLDYACRKHGWTWNVPAAYGYIEFR